MTDEEVEALRQRIKQLEQQLEQLQSNDDSSMKNAGEEHTPTDSMNRRTFLKTLVGGTAGLGMMSMASGFEIRGTNDFSFYGTGNPAFNVSPQGDITAKSIHIDTNEDPVHKLAGNNLTVDSNGTLNAASGGGIDLENTDGTPLVQNASAVQAGTDLDFTDDGDGTATLDYTGSDGSSSGSSTPVFTGSDASFEHIKIGASDSMRIIPRLT